MATQTEVPETLQTTTVLEFNVGGRRFMTTRATLFSRGSNFLTALVKNDEEGKIMCTRDNRGALFIDRNPDGFAMIIDYLRSGQVFKPPGWTEERVASEFGFYSVQHPFAGTHEEPSGLPRIADVLLNVVHFDSLEDALTFWKSKARLFVTLHFNTIKEGAVQRLHKQHHMSLLCYFGFSPLSDVPKEVEDWPLQGNWCQVPGCMNGTMALAMFVEEVAIILSFKLGMQVAHGRDRSGVHTLELKVLQMGSDDATTRILGLLEQTRE